MSLPYFSPGRECVCGNVFIHHVDGKECIYCDCTEFVPKDSAQVDEFSVTDLTPPSETFPLRGETGLFGPQG